MGNSAIKPKPVLDNIVPWNPNIEDVLSKYQVDLPTTVVNANKPVTGWSKCYNILSGICVWFLGLLSTGLFFTILVETFLHPKEMARARMKMSPIG